MAEREPHAHHGHAAETKARTKVALVLSAGAPHSPLMAGALCAFHEQRKTFDIIYTSGAGALIGLLFVAPKGRSAEEALRGLVGELGVSDPIYRLFPVNYKAFLKPGPFTRPIHRWAQLFKVGRFPFRPIPEPQTSLGEWYNSCIEARRGSLARFYDDLIDMWAAVITPTTLTYWSKGLCPPLPFLEDLIEFKKLGNFPGKFFVNAFSPQDAQQAADGVRPSGTRRSGTGKGIALFGKDEIDARHVRAAFAYPFIYEPVTIDGTLYFEGADRDPISFGNLLTSGDVEASEIKTLVLVDILGSLARHLLREPRDLWDAFGLSILVPVVAHAQQEVARFEEALAQGQLGSLEFLKVRFQIPDAMGPHITDWSYSNMSKLFEIGRRAGLEFCRQHGHKLPTASSQGAAARNIQLSSPQEEPKAMTRLVHYVVIDPDPKLIDKNPDRCIVTQGFAVTKDDDKSLSLELASKVDLPRHNNDRRAEGLGPIRMGQLEVQITYSKDIPVERDLRGLLSAILKEVGPGSPP